MLLPVPTFKYSSACGSDSNASHVACVYTILWRTRSTIHHHRTAAAPGAAKLAMVAPGVQPPPLPMLVATGSC